jgi:choline dehydrogenase-like flavoprotein
MMGAAAEFTNFEIKKTASEPSRNNGIYVVRFRNLRNGPQQTDFIRGYGYQGGSGPDFDFGAEGFGASYKRAVKAGRYRVSLDAFGESLARWDNYCEIDPQLKDAWGIPALHIEVKDGDNELNMAKDASNSIEELFHAAGWDIVSKTDRFYPPGYSIHEVGTARMGDNPKTSVLNKWNQSHDIKNLFVVDGASFVTCGWQNPTMTILSLSMRASEYLADQMKKRNI